MIRKGYDSYETMFTVNVVFSQTHFITKYTGDISGFIDDFFKNAAIKLLRYHTFNKLLGL